MANTCLAKPIHNLPHLTEVSPAKDGKYMLGKAHTQFAPSNRSFPSVALETVPGEKPTDTYLGLAGPSKISFRLLALPETIVGMP